MISRANSLIITEEGPVLTDLDSVLLGSLESIVNEQQGNMYGVKEVKQEKEGGVSLRIIIFKKTLFPPN